MSYYQFDDYSDSDDLLSDDGDYYDIREKLRENAKPRILTEAEKLQQQKKYFYSAVCSGNKNLVIEYINNGSEVNMDLENGWTPLLLSVSFGNAELSEELIKRGADVNSRRDGITALMMACNCPKETSPFSESLKVIQVLVENGANVKAINRKRMTALMFAANSGNVPAVKYLLPLSDKNAEDNQRWTALFWAVNGNQADCVQYLLQEGLGYVTTDVRNNTPLDIAKNNGFTDVINLFPNEELDIMSSITETNYYSFEDIFSGGKPKFFVDICNILSGVKAEETMKIFADSGISLDRFLSISDDDLKHLGVKFPYQRYRILAGIHKFHKHPFHPKSLLVIKQNEVYSNTDIAVQLLTTIKQLIAMEACLTYVRKNRIFEELTEEDIRSMQENVRNIRRRVKACKKVTEKLYSKTSEWDKELKPADLITSESRKVKLPWRKIIMTISLISVIFLCKFRK